MNSERAEKLLTKIKLNPNNVSFEDLSRICEHFFGPPRHKDGSHFVYKTPWPGNPRINIQNDKGMAKTYQVRQVLSAIALLEAGHGR